LEGFDNSGKHCSHTKNYNTKLLNAKIEKRSFIENISLNDEVLSAFLTSHKNSKEGIIFRAVGRLTRAYNQWRD